MYQVHKNINEFIALIRFPLESVYAILRIVYVCAWVDNRFLHHVLVSPASLNAICFIFFLLFLVLYRFLVKNKMCTKLMKKYRHDFIRLFFHIIYIILWIFFFCYGRYKRKKPFWVALYTDTIAWWWSNVLHSLVIVFVVHLLISNYKTCRLS